jgi:hypothetical protein
VCKLCVRVGVVRDAVRALDNGGAGAVRGGRARRRRPHARARLRHHQGPYLFKHTTYMYTNNPI